MVDEKNSTPAEAAVTEVPAAAQTSAGENPELAELKKALVEARAKAEENWDLVLRTKAEAENVRRRGERDVENAHKYALERFVGELLPVIDSLEMGLSVAANSDDSATKLMEGSRLTLKMFQDALQKFGVKALDPQGEPFSPQSHQAMSMMESAEVAPNTVLVVYQKGYMLNDRLVRPARVVVSKAAANAGAGKIDEHA